MWVPRALLLAYLAWIGLRCLRDPMAGSLFSGITLGIHELGHAVLAWAPRFLEAAGGSIAQVAAPAAAVALFYRQRDFFGSAVAGCWLAFSLFSLGTYIGDARSQELPLVGLSENPEHDWHYLLSAVGMLGADRFLGFLTRALAALVLAASLALGAWLCATMFRSRRSRVSAG
jgi:hypothetical protein